MRSSDLSAALLKNPSPLFLEFQPIKDITELDRPARIFEALLRYREGDRILTASEILPAIGNDGYLWQRLDRWVMDQVLIQMGTDTHCYAINLSGDSIQYDQIARSLQQRFSHCSDRLIIEISEECRSSSMADLTVPMLASLCPLWLDDYGSGHASLERIGEWWRSLRGVKIHGLLIQRLITQPDPYRDLVRNILSLCESLGLVCVAEWVETEETLAILLEMRQGFPRLQLFVQGWVVC